MGAWFTGSQSKQFQSVFNILQVNGDDFVVIDTENAFENVLSVLRDDVDETLGRIVEIVLGDFVTWSVEGGFEIKDGTFIRDARE